MVYYKFSRRSAYIHQKGETTMQRCTRYPCRQSLPSNQIQSPNRHFSVCKRKSISIVAIWNRCMLHNTFNSPWSRGLLRAEFEEKITLFEILSLRFRKYRKLPSRTPMQIAAPLTVPTTMARVRPGSPKNPVSEMYKWLHVRSYHVCYLTALQQQNILLLVTSVDGSHITGFCMKNTSQSLWLWI